MDKLLYGATPGTKHAEGIDILAIVKVTLCTVLLVQPVLQCFEGVFSWALILVHYLRVDGRGVCNEVRGRTLPFSTRLVSSTIFFDLRPKLHRHLLPPPIVSFSLL